MHVERSFADGDVAPPGLAEERLARYDAACAPCEREEDVELDAGELGGLSQDRDLTAPDVDRHVADPDSLRDGVRRRAA